MASFTVPCPKAGSTSLARVGLPAQNLPRNVTRHASLSFGFQGRKNMLSALQKVQTKLNKVNAVKTSNSVATSPPSAKSVVGPLDEKERDESTKETIKTNNVPDPESISAFMAQISDLIKLVDSRDIVELQLKQLDCEVTIKKKEALEQPPPQIQYAAFPPPAPHAAYTSPPPQPQVAPAAGPPALPAPASAPAKPNKSSHPPLKSPMAGTFYRSPAPGEPPFVKVGDKVQKGQVVCIIEAMKLMNEIEADQSGTLVEIVAEDGKPVSVDTPLFVIAP